MDKSSIRLADTSDVPELLRMSREFYQASGYEDVGEFSEDAMRATLSQLMVSGSLLITDGAMIGFIVFPAFMTGTPVAQELFWWVDPDKRQSGIGKMILEAAEDQAKAMGASHMMMLCLDDLDPEKAANIYGKMGYKARERTFMRAL